MPGNPFKAPFRGGRTSARPKRPHKPNANQSNVPKPVNAIGVSSKAVPQPRTGRVRVTTNTRKGVSRPAVRQGAQIGTPGRHG